MAATINTNISSLTAQRNLGMSPVSYTHLTLPTKA